ncbi:PilZ domain-containing protein [Hyphomicrobium sp. CS1GBMeth3]|uniref:PilZ domain-containing protein n=1 Tax=Hyphomicrobium sp. CS1GBMeth3 TaxID=1892845 RepID=UPI000A90C8FA|nr:PilZ domain-containing protein [Hyphomicrobium sp. CS1GBMeth3]
MSFLDTIRRVLFGKETRASRARGTAGPDNRRVRRIPQRMRSGYVYTDKLITPRACMFRDLSVGGARVEVLGEPIKPSLLIDGLRLYFESEKHEVPCSVAWMKGRMMGLKFEGRPRPPSRRYR